MSEEDEIDEIDEILKECDYLDLQNIKYYAKQLKAKTDTIKSKETLLEESGFNKVKDKVKELMKDYDDLVNNKNKKRFIENECKICELLEENENIIKENEILINEIRTMVKPCCDYMFVGLDSPEYRLHLYDHYIFDEIYMLKQMHWGNECNISEMFIANTYSDDVISWKELRENITKYNRSFEMIDNISKSLMNLQKKQCPNV